MHTRRKIFSLLALTPIAALARPGPAEAATTVQGIGVSTIRVLTQAQYNALVTKPSTTLFVIRG